MKDIVKDIISCTFIMSHDIKIDLYLILIIMPSETTKNLDESGIRTHAPKDQIPTSRKGRHSQCPDP